MPTRTKEFVMLNQPVHLIMLGVTTFEVGIKVEDGNGSDLIFSVVQ